MDLLLWVVVAAGIYCVGVLISLGLSDCDLVTKRALRKGAGDRLRGKVVWITGASSGIGEFLAYEFARQGARLVLSARRASELDRVKAACRLPDKDVMVLPLDILDFDRLASSAQTVVDAFGSIDILVNNAGRSQRALLEETHLDVDRQCFELNCLAPVALTRAVLPHMLRQGDGHVVSISSVAGKLPSPVSASYTMAKHGLQGWMGTLRVELADRGISVTCICPGPVQSPGSANSFTGKPDEVLGLAKHEQTKMPTARCATICVAAIAHRVEEVWVSRHPVLFFVYLYQYLPMLGMFFGKRIGAKRVHSFKTGADMYGGLFASAFKSKKP